MLRRVYLQPQSVVKAHNVCFTFRSAQLQPSNAIVERQRAMEKMSGSMKL